MDFAVTLTLITGGIGLALLGLSKLVEKAENKHGEKKYGKEEWARAKEYNKEENVIERERIAAIASQKSTEPWAVRYCTSPCPYCGHYKVRYAKWEDKSLSVSFWGIASSKIGTNYKCEHCKRMW